MLRKDIGNFLKTTREERGIFQKDLAHEFGVTPSYLSQVENGVTPPSEELLQKYIHKFDLLVTDLYVISKNGYGIDLEIHQLPESIPIDRGDTMNQFVTKKRLMGERLAKLINSRGLSQKEFAQQINANPSYVSRWVNGKLLMGTEWIYIIANHFNVSVPYLMAEDELTEWQQIGKNIRNARERKGMKMTDVCKAASSLGLEPLKLSVIEEGQVPPTEAELRILAGILDMDVHQFKTDYSKIFDNIRTNLSLLGIESSKIDAIIEHIEYLLSQKTLTRPL